jgi:hypothetical protein
MTIVTQQNIVVVEKPLTNSKKIFFKNVLSVPVHSSLGYKFILKLIKHERVFIIAERRKTDVRKD